MLADEVFVPPGICSVGTGPSDEKSHRLFQDQMQQGGSPKKQPPYRQPDERHHDHAPKEQQVDKGSTGKGDAGLGPTPAEKKSAGNNLPDFVPTW